MMPFKCSKNFDRKFKDILITVLLVFQFCKASPPGKAETELAKQSWRPGFCNFGRVRSCCYGWRKAKGECQPVCVKPCINGICIGPDRCSCNEGYTGERCNRDINECGQLSRPCSHSCMNTPGSFRCYCDPGYTLDADGKSCNHVDECKGATSLCSERQTCRNTFGGYVCTCKSGYILGILANSITCRDEDECVTGRNLCSRHARCTNTDGSYTCKCENDYIGDGFSCWKRKSGRSQNGMYFQYKLLKRSRTTDTRR